MLEFAANEFKLLNKEKDGKTLRSHLEQVEKATGVTPPELLPKELPLEVTYIWNWFLELNSARSSNGFGSNPISWQEIESWQKLRGIKLDNLELEFIKLLDVTFLQNTATKEK